MQVVPGGCREGAQEGGEEVRRTGSRADNSELSGT